MSDNRRYYFAIALINWHYDFTPQGVGFYFIDILHIHKGSLFHYAKDKYSLTDSIEIKVNYLFFFKYHKFISQE